MLGPTSLARVAGGLTMAGLLAGCSHVSTGELPDHSGGLRGPQSVGESPEQQANDQAHAALVNYYAVLNRLARSAGTDLDELQSLATKPQIEQVARMIEKQRGHEPEQTLVSSRPKNYRIPKDPATGGPIAGNASLDLDTCVNGLPDQSTSGDAPSAAMTTMENPQWPDPAGWRVASVMHTPGARCDDSPF